MRKLHGYAFYAALIWGFGAVAFTLFSFAANAQDATAALRDGKSHTGAAVLTVSKNSNADAGGLRPSDVLLAMNGTLFSSEVEWYKLRDTLPVNVPATLIVLRGGEFVTLHIPPDKHHKFGFTVDFRQIPANDLKGSLQDSANGIPEIPDFPQANTVQKNDLDALRIARETFYRINNPSWIPTDRQQPGKPNISLKCRKEAQRIDYVYRGGGNYADHIRVELPACGKLPPTVWGIVQWGGNYYAGWLVVSEGIQLHKGGIGIYYASKANQFYGLSLDTKWGIFSYIRKNESGPSFVLRTFNRFFASGSEVAGGPATMLWPKSGWVEIEIDAKEQINWPSTVVFTSIDGKIQQTGSAKCCTDAQRALLEETTLSVRSLLPYGTDEGTRIDTKVETPLGPAGTYFYGGALPFGALPLAKDVSPSPGTVAKNLNNTSACTYQPLSIENWMPWALSCTDNETTLYSADGAFRLTMSKIAQPAMTLEAFDPAQPGMALRTWKANEFTATNPPLPIGEAAMFNGDALMFRGSFEGLEPTGEGQCLNADNGTEPCRFTQGQRSDAAYLARQAEQKLNDSLAKNKKAAQEAMAEHDRQRQQTIADTREVERLRRQEIAAAALREKREKAARRNAMWGNIAGGITQAAGNISSELQKQTLLAAQRNAQMAEAHAQQQARDAAAAQQAAQQRQQQAAAAASAARTTQQQREANTQQQQAALAAQKAAQQAANARAAQQSAQQKTDALAAQKAAQQSSSGTQRLTGQQSAGSSAAGNGLSPGSTSAGDRSAPPLSETEAEYIQVREWPEGLAICQERGGNTPEFCYGPLQRVPSMEYMTMIGRACGWGDRKVEAHDYGILSGYRVWGCGYGVDYSNPKRSTSFNFFTDTAAKYNTYPATRRSFHCSRKTSHDTPVCWNP